MDDREIIALLWNRAENAISALAEKFGHRLQRLAGNILRNPWDVEECVNDTYLALWNSIPPKHPDPLAPYALRLCKNIAVSRMRTVLTQKRSGYEIALDELSECIGTASLEEILDARELGQAIDRFLDTLTLQNRVIFLRRHWYGDAVSEIAIRVGLSENTVSVRLNRTRNKLRAYLIKEGYYE